MKIEGKEYVDATKLSLDEWLGLFRSEKREKLAFITYESPTDSIREEYIASKKNRSEKEVIDMIRNCLITSGS